MALFSEWTERTRLIVTASVAGGINILLAVFLFLAVREDGRLSQQYAVIAAEAATLQQKANSLPEKQEAKRKVEMENADIIKKLPKRSEVDKLMDRISEVAAQCQVQLQEITEKSGGPPPMGAPYAKKMWGTTMRVNFHSLTMFVNLVEERFDRFMAFEDLNINANGGGLVPHGSAHDVRVDVATYRYLQ